MPRSTDTSHKTSLSDSLRREAQADYDERKSSQQQPPKDELKDGIARQQLRNIEAAQKEALQKETEESKNGKK